MAHRGLDVGTNMLVAGMMDDGGNPVFKMQRDAFYRIVPKTDVNKNSIMVSLKKRGANFIIDEDGSFIVVGEDALEIAIERNDTAQRPMQKGVISPKEKASLPMLKLIIETLIGKGKDGDKCIYSVPATPIDNTFDIMYHTEMMGMYIKQMGFDAHPINEAFAIALSELLDDGLTGVALSCVVPGTKIYTDKGIVDIENVCVDDKVITHKGRFKRVNRVITKEFEGLCTKIQLQGYTDGVEQYKFVDNHELYVNRDNVWKWVGCEDLKIGDIVGEPIIKQDLNYSIPTISVCERVTSSSKYSKKRVRAGSNVQRLIGYFLGDGSVQTNTAIQFDFGIHEKDNINDVIDILDKCFKKSASIIDKGEGCRRVICYSKGMASWFRKNCYDKNNEKVYPWALNRLNRNQCLNLLAGLVRSDGSIKDNYISFYNTSTNLTQLCKQLFSKLGIAAAITYRGPRTHLFKSENRLIEGKKQEWVVSTGKKSALVSIHDIIKNINCDNSIQSDRLFIYDGFCCSRVQNIEHEEYSGVVYDLQVEDDHSFSGPYLTIHNCGAGMANICVVHEGDPLVEFSVTRAGDFIDNSVGNALDVSPSLVQMEKEAGTDLYNPQSKIMEAVSVYYTSVINYTLQNIAYELKRREKELPLFRDPVPIIVAGGLTKAEGFVRKASEVLATTDFPLKVSEIRRATNPMKTVANGCLLAANI